jgi:hypothetical protein
MATLPHSCFPPGSKHVATAGLPLIWGKKQLSACCHSAGRLHRLHHHCHHHRTSVSPCFSPISIHQQQPQQHDKDTFIAPSRRPTNPNLPLRHPDRIPDQPLPKMTAAATTSPPASSPPAEPKKKEPLGTPPVKEKKAEEDDDDSDSDSDDPEGKGKEAGAKGKEHDASAKPHSSAKKHAKDPNGKPKTDAGECSILAVK